MKTNRLNSIMVIALAIAALGIVTQRVQAAPPLSGAIFTTIEDGSIVNENVHYEAKEDVYLDGGPGINAPPTAAGLPEGDYYFQVTDPSGKQLLSTDHISCRKIHVNGYGVIDAVYGGTDYVKEKGDWVPVPFQHNQGIDIDHSALGAITVQLYPYDDTPNRGGVYKVWITPVDDYEGLWGDDYVPEGNGNNGIPVNGENYQPGNYHGFIPAKSKTDNYKVRRNGNFVSPEITVRKFHDKNINGVQDAGEEDVLGWEVHINDPLGNPSTEYTPALIVAEPYGVWTTTESTPSGTIQTVSLLDGAMLSLYPTADPTVLVSVAGSSRETHEVVYGNVGLGSITACKIYDRNGDGVVDAGEPEVPGWKMQITGIDVLGKAVGPIVQVTGADGCTAFENLLPGTYTVTEVIPDGWLATGLTSVEVVIQSSLEEGTVVGTSGHVTFTNVCFATADFDTKGYWHNFNGLSELTQADIDYVNSLLPYSQESAYFDDGDEPFDGYFTNGTQVEPAIGDGNWQGQEVSPAGSAKAEISQFLVDQNAGSSANYHREQLAQQLLAFIFNVRHRLDCPDASIESDGHTYSAQDLIEDAIALWLSGTDAQRTEITTLLDWFNNNNSVSFIPCFPCEVVY